MANKAILQASPDAEKFVLGSILLDSDLYPTAAQQLEVDDFSLQDHRSIFSAMAGLQAQGIAIDRLTLFNELTRQSTPLKLEYLVYLDEAIPQKVNIAAYVAIVKEKSRLRKLIRHARDVANAASAPDAMSSEVVAKAQAGLLEVGNTLDSRGQMVGEFIRNFPGGINNLLMPWASDQGVKTGFYKLDQWTSGIHRNEIFTVAARPGQGKTALGLNIITNIAKQGGLCALFSMEMSKRSCLNRLICAQARVDVNRFRAGFLNQGEREKLQTAASVIDKLPIYIDDRSGLRVSDISMAVASLSKEAPVAAFAIDYFQLLRPKKGVRYGTENDMFTAIAHGLQLFCKTSGVPMILLSQLNRESERSTGGDKRPKLSQCRGAGAIEEITNVGGVIYRESMYRRDREDLRGTALFIVDKNREGPSGDIKLLYLDYLTKFENRAEDIENEEALRRAEAERGAGGAVGGEATGGDEASA